MLSKVVDEIDKAGLGNLSLDGPAAEDAALVVAAQNGDGHAFEILVGRHEQRIFFVARRITRTREDAEDVVYSGAGATREAAAAPAGGLVSGSSRNLRMICGASGEVMKL